MPIYNEVEFVMEPESDKDETTCPFCNSLIGDHAQFAKTRKKYDSERAREMHELARQMKLEHRKFIAELKESHREEIQKVRQSAKDNERQLRERMAANAKIEKDEYKNSVEALRKSQQDEIESLRNGLEKQSLQMQKEQEGSFNAQLKEMIHNYGSLATSHQKDVERLRKEQDEVDLMLRKKDTEIAKLRVDLARSSSRLEVRELAVRLQERDATIAKLNARLRELEGLPAAPRQTAAKESKPQAKTMTEDEQREKLKEYMRAIIEITRSQQAEKKAVESKDPVEGESRVDKVLGWFL